MGERGTGRLIEAEYRVEGAVQGVGFRPFLYRLARSVGLGGWVRNDLAGVTLGLVGAPEEIAEFLGRLREECPRVARVDRVRALGERVASARGAFRIVASDGGGRPEAVVTPDLAICDDCLRELRDSRDRRYRYPMINCAHCGPRYSIIERLPYDRGSTTMRGFGLCDRCRAEYENPLDRRYHAEAIACAACGPSVALWERGGAELARDDAAVAGAARALRAGAIVAVKGLGGFHLMVDMRDDRAVRELRRRKRREEKPFALMMRGMSEVEACCEPDAAERRTLCSYRAPIVLVAARGVGVASSVAPGNPRLGVMLPYTGLHHLLLDALDAGVVATSGNLSEEPICTDEREALDRLGAIADLFLVHDRPVARPLDDSVVQVVDGEEMVLRCARGYAPLPLDVGCDLRPVLAVGGHLKSAVAVTAGSRIMLGQHVGDLETVEARVAFERSEIALRQLYGVAPERVICDLHPDYASTMHARATGWPVVAAQHHLMHLFSCIADARARGAMDGERWWEGRVLGVVWDGTGHGIDGKIWGGEFLEVTGAGDGWRRVAHWREFALPGGERAIREPWRSAFGLLWERGDGALLTDDWLLARLGLTRERAVTMAGMIGQGLNSPRCSSAGRIFDAVAAIAGVRCGRMGYEGQAAMELEFAAGAPCGEGTGGAYPIRLLEEEGGAVVLDWGPMLEAMLADARGGAGAGVIGARFHTGLAGAIARVAERLGYDRAVLTGGCFQNRLLLRSTVEALRAAGIAVEWNRRVPINDGGIAVGQAYWGSRQREGGGGGIADSR